MAELDAEQAFLRSMQEEDASASPKPQSSNTVPQTQQPRTIGGFIDDDDEDEEDIQASKPGEDGTQGSLNVDRASSNTPQGTMSTSPNTAVPVHDISRPSTAQDQDQSGADVHDGETNGVPNLAAMLPNVGVAAEESDATNPAPTLPVPLQIPVAVAEDATATSLPKARLPHDRIGILEDRIKEDPRGDMDAWLSLINEHRRRNKLDDARSTYDRFFKVFPSAADQWVSYANMELEHNDFYHVEQIFNKSLLTVPNVQLWSTYLNYVRRRNNITTDSTGNARQIVNQTYDFVLQNIGIDKDSGPIWQDYLQFIRSAPGQVGGTGWQDQQKMDSLRKAYQRAICIPTQAVNSLWKEYDSFEMGLNKITGRKFLQEKSPSYMTARSSNTALQNITRDLTRNTLPTLPPALGFDGDAEYTRQVESWKRWIEWEKEDPLVLKEEDEAAFKARILYVYKQSVMSLRFWPEIWCEAAEFCFSNGLESEGNDFLMQGSTANPESCLLAFKRADHIEATTSNEEGDESIIRRGKAVREPYDNVLDALYESIAQVKQKEGQVIARITESFSKSETTAPTVAPDADDDDNYEPETDTGAILKAQIEAVQRGNAAQTKLLGRTVSFVWIALMRAMRRVQGKGKVGDPIGGSRQIFTDARARGRLTSDVYVASALIEYHCYKDVAATKIFERGMKLFKEDEQFALEYLKHLIAINDTTNARAVFETTVTRLAQKPENAARAKPIYSYFHDFEARYGELSQVIKLEQRMRDLFPEDTKLLLFSQRYASQGFDPTAIRPIISPTQSKPKVMQSIEGPSSMQDSPRPSVVLPIQLNHSPKRPFDESDNESLAPPRKIVRAESPLKGAAGRRMDAQKRTQLRNEVQQNGNTPQMPPMPLPPLPPPPSLPPQVLHLLSIIPRAETYNATYFSPEKMANLIRNADLSKYQARPPVPLPGASAPTQYGYGQMNPSYGYGR